MAHKITRTKGKTMDNLDNRTAQLERDRDSEPAEPRNYRIRIRHEGEDNPSYDPRPIDWEAVKPIGGTRIVVQYPYPEPDESGHLPDTH